MHIFASSHASYVTFTAMYNCSLQQLFTISRARLCNILKEHRRGCLNDLPPHVAVLLEHFVDEGHNERTLRRRP